MAYTTINKPTDYFNTKIYTGTGSSNAVTGVGFQPDMVWFKSRSNADEHNIFDVLRGVTKVIEPSTTLAEYTQSNGLTAFGSDGFTVGDFNAGNRNNGNIVAWNWKANGAGSANTTGSLDSTVSVNTTAGFSIVSWTGNGSTETIGHGLGSVPKMIITKSRTNGGDWWGTYHHSLGNNKALFLNDNAAAGTRTYWANSSPTANVFYVSGERSVNGSGENLIAYCFAEKQGYSKIGSYTGNGANGDGTFIYTGFKVAWLMVKKTDSGTNWNMYDNKRSSFNSTSGLLRPDTNAAEAQADEFDFLSNGFKARNSAAAMNASGSPYIYMAFAEAPLVGTNGVTAKAR